MISPELLDISDEDEIVQYYEEANIIIAALIVASLFKQDNVDYSDAILNEALNEITSKKLNIRNSVRKKYNEVIKDDMQSYKPLFEHKGLKFELDENNLETLNIGIRRTNGTLDNLTGVFAFASRQAYVDAVDKAYMQTSIGGVDYNTAIRNAVKELTEKGITLKDSLGRNIQLKTAVKRNLLMGLQQTANEINEKVADELGCNGYETTAHVGARPSHQVWQGRMFAKTRKDAKKYGVGYWGDIKEELNDYNCRHHYSGIILGISEPAYTEEELKKMQDPDLNEKITKTKAKKSEKYNLQRAKRIYEKSGVDAKEEISEINSKIRKVNQDIRNINKKKQASKLDVGSVFNYKGNKYVVDNKHVKNEFRSNEIAFANWISQRINQKVMLNPKINYPEAIKVPDLTIGNEFYDMKIITGSSNQVIYHNVYKKSEQTRNFLFEATNSPLSMASLKEQVNNVFNREDTKYVNKIGIKKGEELIILENKKRNDDTRR